LNGLFQPNEGLVVLASFKVDPSQAIGDIPITRFDFQCSLNQGFGFIQVNSQIRISIAQIVHGFGIVGCQVQHRFDCGYGILFVAHFVINNAQSKMKPGILIISSQSLQQDFQGLIITLQLFKKRPQIKIIVAIIRFMYQGILNNANGTVNFPLIVIEHGDVDDGIIIEL
jgi:hypothetical protein